MICDNRPASYLLVENKTKIQLLISHLINYIMDLPNIRKIVLDNMICRLKGH